MPVLDWDQSSVTGRVLDHLRDNEGQYLTTICIVEAISLPSRRSITHRQVYLACEELASDETSGVVKNGRSYALASDPTPSEMETRTRDETMRLLSEYLDAISTEENLASLTTELKTSTPMASSRDSEILQQRESGKTLDEIGTEFGITRERVRQIVKASGGPTPSELKRKKELRRIQEEKALTRQIRSHLDQFGPHTAKEVAEALNLTENRIRAHWPSDRRHLRLQYQTSDSRKHWTNGQIILAIQEAATFEFPLTGTTYSELIHLGEVSGPSLALIHKRFNGWIKACNEAGVESKSAPRGTYQSKWTDDDLLSFTREYLLDSSHPGTADGYIQWRKKERVEAPSLPTLRNRLGTWNAIKRRALGADDE